MLFRSTLPILSRVGGRKKTDQVAHAFEGFEVPYQFDDPILCPVAELIGSRATEYLLDFFDIDASPRAYDLAL